MTEDIKQLKDLSAKQNNILKLQQGFLKKLNNKERQNNIIITGVPENTAFEGENTDNEKVPKLFQAA